MNPLKKLFKQTAIYGLATVLPRMLSFVLVPLYTGVMATGMYGELNILYSWFAIFNVILAYGMETAFFRFYSRSDDKTKVVSTSLITILASTIFFILAGYLFQDSFANMAGVHVKYVRYAILILALDALVIIPFAWLRANEKPMRYAILKILNVVINLGLNVFLLLFLPKIVANNTDSIFGVIYVPNFEITYILIANLVASAATFGLLLKLYTESSYNFDSVLWKKMMHYAWPVLIAGIAFTINEVFDRILLEQLLPPDIAKSEIGKYSACYKLGLFMTLYATAFRMGIEPFFFSHAETENPQKTYAQITNYFVIIGSAIFLGVVVFSDLLKQMFVRDESYWEAMTIVPFIVLASFFLGIYHNLSVWYKVTDKTRFGAIISLMGAFITIGINYAFIPSMGYLASAIATMLAYGSMMVLSYYLGQKHYPVPYNNRKFCFYLGVSMLFAFLSFYIFERNLIVGSFLLGAYLLLIYRLEKDSVQRLFFNGPKKSRAN